MQKSAILIDSLTGIYNEVYLIKNYQKYLNNYGDCNFIMFDFTKFKHYNDTYGHDVGDIYLKLFSELLKETFKDSIVARLHGDEYAILTKYSNDMINKAFDLIDAKIKMSFESSIIPELFKYNAGISKAEHGIKITREKADYMMYNAKKNNNRSQDFDENIWKEKADSDNFNKSINDHIENNALIYHSQQIYDMYGEKVDMRQIYTRDSMQHSLFDTEAHDLLTSKQQLKKIDLYNIRYLLSTVNIIDDKIIINFNCMTFIEKEDIFEYLGLLMSLSGIDTSKIIVSLNINDLSIEHFDKAIEIINNLKDLNLKVCIDKYSTKTSDEIYENSSIDYIKLDANFWKKGIINSKTDYILNNKIDMFMGYKEKTVPIFTRVENEDELRYLQSLNNKNILLCGNQLEEEKKLVFKKVI